ncbi:MAG: stimulus-sensing domain-containing protein [Pseudomonadota bacterium]
MKDYAKQLDETRSAVTRRVVAGARQASQQTARAVASAIAPVATWTKQATARVSAYFGLAGGATEEERSAGEAATPAAGAAIGAADDGGAQPSPATDDRAPRPLWTWRDPFGFSTIAGRIAALNVVALAILVGGVLYLSQFREGLIDQKIESLTTEAQLIAITIAESAGDPQGSGYDRILANEVLRRVSLPTGLRAQIYDRSGRLTGDTRSLFRNQVLVEVTPIDDGRGAQGVLDRIEDLYSRALAVFSEPPEIYKETPPAGISRDMEVYEALNGRDASAERVNSEKELILSVATPVQRVKTVMGALVLSTQGGDIDEIVSQERIAILQVFVVAFLVTVLVSLALARTVAWPIRQLALAAERSGGGDGGPLNPERIDIPDLSERRDEIGHLSSALRRMTVALYSRIDAIETFAADVSHEIKNPLTSLRSAVETLRGARTADQREALLGVIEHDVRRLDRLVTDISNASRLDAELVREQRESFDLSRLLTLIADASACQAEPREVTVRLNGCETKKTLRGLEPRLAQVFHNLLDNAISFSPERSVIAVTLAEAELSRRPAFQVTVTDEGPGVPQDNLESIFERFYSERPSGEEFGRHSGLGLSICRQIIDAHGGRIWAENRKDRSGARFHVLLPR